MSAIFGIQSFSSRCTPGQALENMCQVLAHRGPDGFGRWSVGPVGLGHGMLRSTPQSLRERLPYEDQNSRLVITADARLDNRKELVEALSESVSMQSADSEIILAAYLKWGERCPEQLLGDFAFAIWDERQQRLFCARDHFGVRPFYYYYSSEHAFVFASEMKALFSLPDVPCELNEVRVGDHLADVFADRESTFYSNILRLPPAHTLTVSREGIRLQSYWELDSSRELRLNSNEEYAEGFREIFTEAVRSRLESDAPVGSMLSGGLDSSSISCVARNFLLAKGEKLRTFSTIFDRVSRCDERDYIDAVLKLDGLDPHFIPGDQTGPFREIERIHWHEDQAFYAPNFAMIWSIYRTVSEKGVRVLLDGHDGDSVVSHGYKYLDELAINGRWLSFIREVRGLSRHYGDSPATMMRVYGSHYGVKPLIAKHRSLRLARRVWHKLAGNGTKKNTVSRSDWEQMLNPDFACRTNIAERHKAWRKTLSNSARSERDAHYRTLTQPLQAFALEVHDSAAAAFSIEKRYPFWDRRVVEFCLSLPPEQKLYHGWTRMVMRRAMENILPKKVQWRGGKMDFSPSLSYGLRSFERETLDQIILKDPGVIESYVDIKSLRQAYERFLSGSGEDVNDLYNIWKCASLALWLKQAWST